MQGKLFQRYTHLLYCSVLSLGGNVNTIRMSQPDMGPIFHIKNQWNILIIGNYYVNYQNYQNLMLLAFSDTWVTLMHLFLFTNSAQRDLVSICTQLQLTFLALQPTTYPQGSTCILNPDPEFLYTNESVLVYINLLQDLTQPCLAFLRC